MDYKNGKIYRMVLDCEDGTTMEYIGSTTTTLVKRLSRHKASFKMHENDRKYIPSSFKLFEKGEPVMVLIENYPCSCKNELERRERETIESRRRDSYNVVNMRLPARSQTELARQRKDLNKKYRETHKDELKVKSSVYYQSCDKDEMKARNKKYNETHRDELKVKKKVYRETNKDEIKSKATKPTPCDHCGRIVQKSYMSGHKKSAVCLSFKVVLDVVESDQSK